MKNPITYDLSIENLISTIKKISKKQKLIAAISTIPFIALSNMSGSCATSCPYGMVNDPYPGQCPRYTDITGDGICDFSQTTAAPASPDTSTSTTDDATTTPNGNGNGANADSMINDQSTDSNASTIPDSTGLDSGNLHVDSTNYFVFPITILLISGYLFTHYLFKKGILKRNEHRRIWNLLLTAGYLGTGITGIILTLLINLGIKTALNQSITYWHAEIAILMVIGTIIHIHIYWKPFKNMFKVLFGIKKLFGIKNNLNKKTS